MLRIIPDEELEIVENGINTIRFTKKASDGTSQAYCIRGHKDFIDDLYAIPK